MIDLDEELERAKLGRFSDADEQLIQRVMGKRFLRRLKHGANKHSYLRPSHQHASYGTRNLRIQERISRSNVLKWGYEHQQGREAVVKVGFCTKHKRQALGQLRYIARLKDSDAAFSSGISLFNEFGELIAANDALIEMHNWHLANEDKTICPSQQKRRRTHIQTWHFIVSIEDDIKDEKDLLRFQTSVHSTIDEAFTANGHKSVWCIHKGHTKHTHAHIIVKALSELGRRIHSDIHGDYLHGLRVVFAKHLNRAGFRYDATRRMDRAWLRDEVMSGAIQLSNHHNHWQTKPVVDICAATIGTPMLAGISQLEQARIALQRGFENNNAKRCAEILRQSLSPPPTLFNKMIKTLPKFRTSDKMKRVPKEYLKLFEAMAQMYQNPHQALVAWHRLSTCASSGLRLAKWVACHRPEWFGPVKAEAFETEATMRLREVLKRQQTVRPNRNQPSYGQNVTFIEHLWLLQVERDRAHVLHELKRFALRIERETNNQFLSERILNLTKRARRIPILPRQEKKRIQDTPPLVPTQQPLLKPRPNKTPSTKDEVEKSLPVTATPIIHAKYTPRSGIER